MCFSPLNGYYHECPCLRHHGLPKLGTQPLSNYRNSQSRGIGSTPSNMTSGHASRGNTKIQALIMALQAEIDKGENANKGVDPLIRNVQNDSKPSDFALPDQQTLSGAPSDMHVSARQPSFDEGLRLRHHDLSMLGKQPLNSYQNSLSREILPTPRNMNSDRASEGNTKFHASITVSNAAEKEPENGNFGVDPMNLSGTSGKDSCMDRNEKNLPKVPGSHNDNMRPCEEGKRSQENDKPICCNKCDRIFGNPESLQRHVTRTHKSKAKVLTCHICQGTYKSRQNLKLHKENVHDKNPQAFCDLCPAHFSTKISLTLHKNNRHRDVLKINSGLKKKKKRQQTNNIVHYRCMLCKYTSDREGMVMSHFKSIHVNNGEISPQFTCFYGCGHSFKSSFDRDRHHRSCSRKPRQR